jgi:hypothetical protein
MKDILRILTFAALLAVNSAFAITPENGWWWNPQESGMGFNIESQNGTVFIATYVYDNSGDPIWYSGSGQLDTNSTVTVDLQISRNGPCPACPYHAPRTTDEGLPIILQFTSQDEGLVSWQGKNTPIQRFNFNYGTGIQRLIGEWVLIATIPVPLRQLSDGGYRGFKIIFDSVRQGQGELIALGKVPGVPDARVTVSAYNEYGYQYFGHISNPPGPTIGKGGVLIGFGVNFSGLNKFIGSIRLPITFSPMDTGKPTVGLVTAPFEAYRVK